MKNEYEVTITARVTKTYRIAAEDGELAVTIGHEMFSLAHESGVAERYEETLDECKLHVRDVVQHPVSIFDSAVRQRGTLYPSGAMRW